METKYGEYTDEQVKDFVKRIRKTIFLLLLAVDKKTKADQVRIDVNKTFDNLLLELGGANSIMLGSPVIVEVMNVLERARLELVSSEYNFRTYRKLILDAGAKMLQIEEV